MDSGLTDLDAEPTRTRVGTLEVELEVERPVSPLSARRFVTLSVLGSNGPSSLHLLDGSVTTIGRATTNTIAVPDSGVSSHHARVFLEHGVHVLEDLNSRNGTHLNGVRITRHVLSDGDRIQIGREAQISVRYQDESELAATKRLYDSAIRDPLTGIFNRRHFQERLVAEWAFSIRHKTNIALIMIDVDHFKRINDTYGHLGGDEVLRTFGASLAREVRAEDVVARYGGEEFAILARSIDIEQAAAFAERLRRVVADLRIPFRSDPIRITASFGVAVAGTDRSISDPPSLIAAADDALYGAKRSGRNRVNRAKPAVRD